MEIKKFSKQRGASDRVVWDRIKETAAIVFSVIYHLRKVILSIPVVWGAIYLARMNMEMLPEQVGLALMSNGAFAETVERSTAVYGPMALTGVCLLLMFCSRRAIYPWLISIFTLIVPPVILMLNVFPA